MRPATSGSGGAAPAVPAIRISVGAGPPSASGSGRHFHPYACSQALSSSAGGFHNRVTISSLRSLAFSLVSLSISV